ncbi:molybdenum cofactor guanylyltransferase [Paenibacillus sp. MZ04-78.2]|uniref:molybdenum cofactor guanylyltransferase n=1 Tax=Paenibacillus sp. MZ04-78.2 TaxID=2962034 RepID=UPI0020B7380E|nr:molybdenum cofactor guanylyltransferase [Paenibacillus sp. MZ04-78.2]MCP3773877.1 molybdenum cofactor guanylyltransferase [Paenibacillus sp. MZ04-78.2]
MTGVILAGGQNRRMGGQSKALLMYEGDTFLARQLAELGSLCTELLIVTQEPERYEAVVHAFSGESPVRIIPDQQPGRGPLAGFQAAMKSASYEELWIVGCDMPWVDAEAAKALSELRSSVGADAAVAKIDGRLHPLHGIYLKNCLPEVERLLAANDLRLMGLLDAVTLQVVDELFLERKGVSKGFIRNINDPDEYERLTGKRLRF